MTSGTQKWNGDKPNFITRAIVISIDAVGFVILVMVHWPEINMFIIIANIRIIEAVA